MKTRAIITILAVILFASTWALPAHAQAEPKAQVITTIPQDKGDSLELHTLFTIFDANGYPIPQDQIQVGQQGQVQLLDMPSAPIPAKIDVATTTLKIVLVIDASGSMYNNISQVKDAAVKFVGDAPANAQFAVVSFSDDSTIELKQFTGKNNVELVKGAIQHIKARQPNTGNTCLYEAAFDAINLITDAPENSDDRQAIVLFTDGRDREGTQQDCTNNQDEIIAKAMSSNSNQIPIQIHTIGLCNDKQCSNVDTSALKKLSTSTYAFYAFTESRSVNELDRVFKTIVSGLNNQWIARAENVKAKKGQNHANLTFSATVNGVPLNDLSKDFYFNTNKNYTAGPLTIAMSRGPDQNGSYEVTLHISNPASVNTVSLEVLEKETGSVVAPAKLYKTDEKAEIKITQKTDGFTEEREYCTRIRAYNDKREPIKITDPSQNEAAEVLAIPCVKYLPSEISVKSAEIDWKNKTLNIHLNNISSGKPYIYAGYINQDNHPIKEQMQGLVNGDLISERLSDDELQKIRQNGGQKKYMIYLSINVSDVDSPLKPYEADFPPPPDVGLVGAIVNAFQNPLTLGIILIIVLIVFAVFIFVMSHSKRQTVTSLSNPPGGTIMGQVAALPDKKRQPDPKRKTSSNPKLGNVVADDGETIMGPGIGVRIKVVKTADHSQIGAKVIQIFPCVIGRGPTANFDVGDDKSVSRTHAKIILQGDKLVLTDCDSVNGTFVAGVRLPPSGARDLAKHNKIRLGRNTELEIETYANDVLTQIFSDVG